MSDAGGVVGGGKIIAYPERIRWIEIAHTMVLDENLRDTVIGRRQQQAMVKSDFKRPGLEVAIPIRCSLAEA